MNDFYLVILSILVGKLCCATNLIFAAGFALRGGDLFPAFSPRVFVSLNTGFDLWCDSASGRPRRSNDEFVLEIIHLPLSECRNIMSRLVC